MECSFLAKVREGSGGVVYIWRRKCWCDLQKSKKYAPFLTTLQPLEVDLVFFSAHCCIISWYEGIPNALGELCRHLPRPPQIRPAHQAYPDENWPPKTSWSSRSHGRELGSVQLQPNEHTAHQYPTSHLFGRDDHEEVNYKLRAETPVLIHQICSSCFYYLHHCIAQVIEICIQPQGCRLISSAQRTSTLFTSVDVVGFLDFWISSPPQRKQRRFFLYEFVPESPSLLFGRNLYSR